MKDALNTERHAEAIALNRVGYDWVKRDTYRYNGAYDDVEHFLYLTRVPRKKLITADFGFRNRAVDEASIDALQRITNLAWTRKIDAATQCYMRFSFWRFFSMTGLCHWSTDANINPDWASAMASDLKLKLLPFVREINSLGKLFRTLASDAEPCPWFAVNGAIRGAELAVLSRKLGYSYSEIYSVLERKSKNIQHDLGARVDLSEFIKAVLGNG